MIIKTNISFGYKDLLDIFFKANNLQVTCIECEREKDWGERHKLTGLEYEENSDTELSITFMSMKHLGFENMLCDYLIKCGISPSLISVGQNGKSRDMKKLDEEWENRRKELGLR